jgi:hypothetical protein
MSAESRAQLEATFAAARQRDLPERPIQNRVAEGQAKGASEAQIVLAAQRMESRLEATQDAMIRAGRRDPSDAEVERGAQAMERGTTSAQLELIARRAPSERSLVVAFEVLSALEARGMAVDNAVAQISSRLEARATDQALVQLTANSSSNGALSIGRGAVTGSGSSSGSANGSANGSAAGGSVAGSVTGTVTGVIKKGGN